MVIGQAGKNCYWYHVVPQSAKVYRAASGRKYPSKLPSMQGFSYLSKSEPRGHLIGENSSLIFIFGKTGQEKLVYFTLKSLKSMENDTIEQVNIF